MYKSKIGFANWPFEKGEKVKLIKISKPYQENGLWYIEALYLSHLTNRPQNIKHNFGDLHLLIYNADYIDGKRLDMPDWAIVDIHIPESIISIKKPEPHCIKDKKEKHEFDYYTFGIGYRGKYFVIPLHEILRATLAPDVFWLNQVTLLDSIDTRVICEGDSNCLQMVFLPDVPVRYVQIDEKIKHAAWVFSNENIYEMIKQIYNSIKDGDGIKFAFLFTELRFTAKVEESGGKVYVKEIISFKGKKINCQNIIVEHPSLVEYEKDASEKEKKWTPVEKADGNKALLSDKTATPGSLDINRYESVQSEYSSSVKIERIRIRKASGNRISLKTMPVDAGETHKRTTADFGGLETVPPLEFANKISEEYVGSFSDIISIFRFMEDRDEVITIGYHIGNLNDHYQFRSICTLADDITPRKYLAGRIQLHGGKEAMFIEIEREKIALSTLIIVSYGSQNWKLVNDQILKGLIKNSGSWPDFESIGIEQLEFYKFKHTNADIRQKENRIFKSIAS